MSIRERNAIAGLGLCVLVALVTVVVTVDIGLDLAEVEVGVGPAGAKTVPTGEPAPSFSLEDLDGDQISLADQRGKVVLVDFWATWCGPCLQELPHIQQLHEEYRERGLVVLAISTDSQKEKVLPFVDKEGYTFPVLYADSQVQAAYGVRGIPAVYLIDRQGMMRFQTVGFGPGGEEKLIEEVEKLLQESDQVSAKI